MSTISNTLTGSSLLAYLQDAASRARTQTGNADSSTAAAKPVESTSSTTRAAVVAASHKYQSTLAQTALDKKQTALASDLRAALANAGFALSGPVTFQFSPAGKLVVGGLDDDKGKVEKFLKADAGKPGFSARLASLSASAETLSKAVKQTATISQAARYASSPSGLLALYATLSKQQDSTAAVFTLGKSDSSLTYAGVLTSKA